MDHVLNMQTKRKKNETIIPFPNTDQTSKFNKVLKLSMYLHFIGHFHEIFTEIILQAQWKTVLSFVQRFWKTNLQNWAAYLCCCLAKSRLLIELINSPFHHEAICHVTIYNCKVLLWVLLRDCPGSLWISASLLNGPPWLNKDYLLTYSLTYLLSCILSSWFSLPWVPEIFFCCAVDRNTSTEITAWHPG